MNLETKFGLFLGTLLIVGLIGVSALWPFVFFWSCNQLINTDICFTFKNWLAFWALGLSFFIVFRLK